MLLGSVSSFEEPEWKEAIQTSTDAASLLARSFRFPNLNAIVDGGLEGKEKVEEKVREQGEEVKEEGSGNEGDRHSSQTQFLFLRFCQPTAALIGRLTKDKRLILPRPLNHFDFVIKVFNYFLPQKKYRQLSVPINEEKKNLFLLFSPPFLTFESGWLYANVLRTIFLLLLRVSYEQGLDN